VAAVRRGWLDALEAQARAMAVSGAWVSGSPAAYPVRSRDVYWSYETNKRHLNGNAVYIVGDACFRLFLAGVRTEYPNMAFDRAMYDYAFRAQSRRALRPLLAPKFIDWQGSATSPAASSPSSRGSRRRPTSMEVSARALAAPTPSTPSAASGLTHTSSIHERDIVQGSGTPTA